MHPQNSVEGEDCPDIVLQRINTHRNLGINVKQKRVRSVKVAAYLLVWSQQAPGRYPAQEGWRKAYLRKTQKFSIYAKRHGMHKNSSSMEHKKYPSI